MYSASRDFTVYYEPRRTMFFDCFIIIHVKSSKRALRICFVPADFEISCGPLNNGPVTVVIFCFRGLVIVLCNIIFYSRDNSSARAVLNQTTLTCVYIFIFFKLCIF